MANLGCSLQEAMDRAGELCRDMEVRFFQLEASLPSWGAEIDHDVYLYMENIKDWIAGPRHWSFMTTRYFGDDAAQVKETRLVKLLPKRQED